MPILARPAAACLLLVLTGCATTPTAPAAGGAPGASTPDETPTGSLAADGRDLSSCEDADCEIEIRAGDSFTVGRRLGIRRLAIGTLGPDGARITLKGSAGKLSVQGMAGSISSNCVNDRCRDEGELVLAPGETGHINDMRLDLTHLTGDRAVLRLTPG
ncbi:hypothetical protein FE391_03780 [Nonomuraea sp. KC401]|uniref:hypothetical protein n=1 Tax=unclassified Nonomuraea TaxID=2593643 RepID=UPI0010FE5061|nr:MULTISPECIES: hypothetical protein [unclassified Nonomuraea]NBE92670.1 hypothetical protein [Nonomuraea sp. K271]TLF84620.1 hypothetical protein FE391_03780 [Nonomuraea sp. KC401]